MKDNKNSIEAVGAADGDSPHACWLEDQFDFQICPLFFSSTLSFFLSSTADNPYSKFFIHKDS